MPNKSMTWGAVATSLDISRLNDLGICVSQDNEILYNEQFNYYIIKFYANYGTGQVSVDTSNFYITKGYPLDVTTNQHGYLSQNQSGVNIQRGTSGPLVTYGGDHILYNSDATYIINEIDNTAHQQIDTTYFSIVEYSGKVGLHLSENSPVQVYNNVQRVDFSITTQSRVGDEVTINADLPYTTSVTSYKLRLADKYPDAVWLYFTPDKSDELIFEDTPIPLYKNDGTLATRTDYGDYELEALEPIPPYISNDGYGRFSNAVFSYATYNSTSDVLHVSFSDLYQGSEDGACITNRLRVNITTPPHKIAQLGGVITSTADVVISVPIEQISGSVAFYGYAYPDGTLLDTSWNFGGIVGEYPPIPPDVVLKVKWGDTVNVPAGYTVSEIRTFVAYVFPSYFKFISSPTMTLAYSGKDEYFDNIINHDLLLYDTPNPSVSTWPIIEVFQGDRINYSDGPHMRGRRFTVGYNNSYSDWVTLVRNTNGTDATAGDYSIYMEGNYDGNARSSIQSGKPARLLWFETNGTVTYWHKSPEAFKVPQSLWSFSNGTFSWLGNSEDTSSLAWYYKHDWELFEWSEFDGTWLYVHCVSLTLPTVSTTWLSIGGSSGNVIIVPNEDHAGYWWDNDSQSYISADWDNNVTYGIIAFYTTPFAYAGRMKLEIKEVSGAVGVHNVSSPSVTVCQANIAICSSYDATIITVYDSSNNPYNAFKYTSYRTDYYYVLDGTQTDWIDDLASIGYSLPTPSVDEYIPGTLGEITSGSYKSTKLSYDSTKVYMFAGRDDNASFVYRDVTCWEIFGNTGTAMVRNLTSNTINVAGSGMVATDKTYVTAINVYNSNNVAYPCFKFNGGQVKYWVWDGAHQYWTSDLTSIGYKLPTIGYLSSDKTAKSMNAGDLDTLYDENGTKMTVSTYGVSYPAVRVYSSSSDTTGTAVVNNNWTIHGPQFSNGDLSVSNLTGSRQTIQRVAFIK